MDTQLDISVEEVSLDIDLGTDSIVVEVEPDSFSLEIVEVVIDANGDTTIIDVDVSPVSLAFEIMASGPRGAPGVSEDDMVYAKRVDFVGDTIIYKGEAEIGTLDADSVWRIRRITLEGTEQDVNEEWANGVGDFAHVWDDRATYTYS
jgi:hypothetical protein